MPITLTSHDECVTVDGVELAVARWAGVQPPLVAIHGLTASLVTFAGLAERLRGRRGLWAVDLRGRGASGKPPRGYGMQRHAKDVAGAMRSTGVGRTVVVGHSMGAYIGAQLAVDEPDLVAGLVMLDGGYLLDFPPGVDPDTLIDVLVKPQVDRLSATYPSREAYFDFWRSLPTFAAADWGPWVEAYLDYDLGGEAPNLRPRPLEAGVREDFASMAHKEEARARLAAIRCPVLVIRAEHGVARGQPPILADKVMEEIRELVPGVEEQRLAGTTHYTIALAEPGVSIIADLTAEFANRCLGTATETISSREKI